MAGFGGGSGHRNRAAENITAAREDFDRFIVHDNELLTFMEAGPGEMDGAAWTEKALQLIATCDNINLQGACGKTALHHAAIAGSPALCEALVKAGAELDARDSMWKTPLHYAAAAENLDLCKALIAAGASLSVLDKDNKTAEACCIHYYGPVRSYLYNTRHPVKANWMIFDDHSVAEVTSNNMLGLKLCHVFNFATQEKIIVSQMEKSVSHSPPQPFDSLDEQQILRAAAAARLLEIPVDEEALSREPGIRKKRAFSPQQEG